MKKSLVTVKSKNPYDSLFNRKRTWTPVQTDAGELKEGAEETIAGMDLGEAEGIMCDGGAGKVELCVAVA